MAEVSVRIGERSYIVECDEGEEEAVQAAAKDFDSEAQSILGVIGKVPEAKVLLMAGLMLGGRLKNQEKDFHAQNQKIKTLESEVKELMERIDLINKKSPLSKDKIEQKSNSETETKCLKVLESVLGELDNLIQTESQSPVKLHDSTGSTGSNEDKSNQTELF